MSGDPIGGNTSNPQTMNRYAYVRNNPINLIDPLGMNGEDDLPRTPPIIVNVYGLLNELFGGFGFFGLGGRPAQNMRDYDDFRGRYDPKPPRDTTTSTPTTPPASGPSTPPDNPPSPGMGVPLRSVFNRLLNAAVCTAAAPLLYSAEQKGETVGAGFGGSVGAGLVFGIALQGSVQVVADSHGNVGIALTGGGNPGFGVFGAGGLVGAQFTNSTANTIYDLHGISHGGGASIAAPTGEGAGIDVFGSNSAATVTVTVGVGAGGKGAGYAITGTAVPNALSTSCKP
jgi:hypothetical protein